MVFSIVARLPLITSFSLPVFQDLFLRQKKLVKNYIGTRKNGPLYSIYPQDQENIRVNVSIHPNTSNKSELRSLTLQATPDKSVKPSSGAAHPPPHRHLHHHHHHDNNDNDNDDNDDHDHNNNNNNKNKNKNKNKKKKNKNKTGTQLIAAGT